MDANCYVCNKKSPVWSQNFTELKTQYTNTPICDIIKSFSPDFDFIRKIDDESNHICIECWKQINDYDLLRQLTKWRENKLRDLLMSTENSRNLKITATEIENDTTIIIDEESNSLSPTVLEYPKPAFAYQLLIFLALKNSHSGTLLVTEIGDFICEHFPYYKTIPNLCKLLQTVLCTDPFEKIERKVAKHEDQRIKCLWKMKSSKITEMDNRLIKQYREHQKDIRDAMAMPNTLSALLRGEIKHGRLNYSSPELDSNIQSVNSVIDSEESFVVDLTLDDGSSLPNKNVIDAEDSSSELSEITLQPMRKRSRL